MTPTLAPIDHRIVLRRVSWATYESLLADIGDSSSPRLAYDRGDMEIMSPTAEHEEYNRTLALLVEVTAEELGIEVCSLGSTTFKRKDAGRGFEPDSCFYVQHARDVRGKNRIDLRRDPPPDLVIEIDVSSPSLDKLPLFAGLGIPEVWRFDGRQVELRRLEDGLYVGVETSLAMAPLTARALTRFVKQGRKSGRLEMLRSFRRWLKTARAK